MTEQPVQDALVERLRKPIDADKIYDWIVQKREETTSDLPRQGFQNEMELIDEDRAEAADRIGASAMTPTIAQAATDPALLARLIEQARSHKMTPQERFDQAVSFVSEGVDKAAVRTRMIENCAFPQEILDRERELGVREERARVVAWLKGLHWTALNKQAAEMFGDAIEHGVHSAKG